MLRPGTMRHASPARRGLAAGARSATTPGADHEFELLRYVPVHLDSGREYTNLAAMSRPKPRRRFF
jgi:hypothetical protein